ncbi:MAG: hypothetical protein JWN22_3127 [Nocardioides sp.]|nr:hypothetical protein [Nocardioides sp.]
MATGTRSGENLALTVHGPVGVLDLLVPAGAAATDVAREYARQSGLPSIPLLFTSFGAPLLPDVALADAGVGAGDVLVATTTIQPPAPAAPRRSWRSETSEPPGALSVVWFCMAVGTAVLAAWFAAHTSSEVLRRSTVEVLAGAAVLGVLPIGRFAAHRALAAPAFAAAAAFALAWDPHPERLPTIVGIAALVGAVAAAVARTLDRRNEEALRVWITVGIEIFLVTALAALGGFPPRVSWAVLLVGAMLAARFVPGFVVDVPDQYLLDLERLAVTAWSARDRPSGRRGRTLVSRAAVAAVAARGTRMLTAYCVAVLVVAAITAPLLLESTPLAIDRIGARCLVFFSGCGLLLAARSYRHAAPRALLRAAGLICLGVLLGTGLLTLSDGRTAALAGTAIVLAGVLIVAAVATGRGWRSAWWSRRAEVAEALCGSAAVASVLVASGVFRSLWESIHIQV